MATTIPSAALVPAAPVFSQAERLALAGFLAGYSGLTREACELDLRQDASWCQHHHLQLFQARRADIGCFTRDLETSGRARATITRRLCTVAGFCRYGVEEELLDHSPATHVRRPRLDYGSHATGLDRNELGALLVAAGLEDQAGAVRDLVAGYKRAPARATATARPSRRRSPRRAVSTCASSPKTASPAYPSTRSPAASPDATT